MARVDYTPRFLTTTYLERGRANVVRVGIYRNGVIVAPTSGTVSLYNRAGTAVFENRTVVIDGSSFATVTVTEAELDAQSLGGNWRILWTLTMPDAEEHTFRNAGALCRVQLPPPATQGDLYLRHPDLANYLPTGQTHWQDQLDAAWTEIDSWLTRMGRRPFLVIDPPALKPLHEFTSLEIICRLLGGTGDDDNKWARLATHYGEKAHAERDGATFEYDETDSGKAGLRRRAASPTLWLGGAPSQRTNLWPR